MGEAKTIDLTVGTTGAGGRTLAVDILDNVGITDPVTADIPASSTWDVLFDQQFTGWSTTTGANPSVTEWNQKMGMGTNNTGPTTSDKVQASSGGLADIFMMDKGGGDRYLRFRLPAGFTDKGTQLWCNLPVQPDEAILEYDIRFEHDFNPWGWGGKLPGLGGVDKTTNTTPGYPSGGTHIPPLTQGWSGRQMWVGRDAGGASSYSSFVGTRPVRGLFYGYGYDQVSRYGDNGWYNTATSSSGSWVSGTWHHMKIHYKLNTVGLANGESETWIDGVSVYRDTTWQPRNNSNVHISHLWMHLFRGGDTAEWGVATDEYIDIDNIKISIPAA